MAVLSRTPSPPRALYIVVRPIPAARANSSAVHPRLTIAALKSPTSNRPVRGSQRRSAIELWTLGERSKVDKAGRVTLRYLSRLHHIGVGRAHFGEPVRLLVANKHVRVIREDGSLLRELTLDYQPLGTPPGPRLELSTMS